MTIGRNSSSDSQLPSASWVHPNPPLGTNSSAFTTTSPAVLLARRRLEITSEPQRRPQDQRVDEQVSNADYERRNRPPSLDRGRSSWNNIRRRTGDKDFLPRKPTAGSFVPQRVRERNPDADRNGERSVWRAADNEMKISAAERRLPSRYERSQQIYAPTTTRKPSPFQESQQRRAQRPEFPLSEVEMRKWRERYGEQCVNDACEDDDGRRFELVGLDYAENVVHPACSAASQQISRPGEHSLSSNSFNQQGLSEQYKYRTFPTVPGDSQLNHPDSAQHDSTQVGGKSKGVYGDSDRGGWKLVSSVVVKGDGSEHSTRQGRRARSNVWEWRGRTIVVQSASKSSPVRRRIGMQLEATSVGDRGESEHDRRTAKIFVTANQFMFLDVLIRVFLMVVRLIGESIHYLLIRHPIGSRCCIRFTPISTKALSNKQVGKSFIITTGQHSSTTDRTYRAIVRCSTRPHFYCFRKILRPLFVPGPRVEFDERCIPSVAKEAAAATTVEVAAMAAAQGSVALMDEIKQVKIAVHALAGDIRDSRHVSLA